MDLETLTLKTRVSSILNLMYDEVNTFDTNITLNTKNDYQDSIKEKVNRLLDLTKLASDSRSLRLALEGEVSFYIQKDINDFLKDWFFELEELAYTKDTEQAIIDFLYNSNRQAFYGESGFYSLRDLESLWAHSPQDNVKRSRFIALMIFYVLTRIVDKEDTLSKYTEAVELFFALRDYLLCDGMLPTIGTETLSQFDLVELKSLASTQELLLLKTLTAGGGVAAALQREDLEGKIPNTIKETKEKRYNRIEKLEE